MQTIQTETIKTRLAALFDSLMADPNIKIPGAFKPVANNLVKSFLKNADETELRKIILDIRENVMPWILGEKE